MSASLSIWSNEPTETKKTFFGILDAAFESRLPFYLHDFTKYKLNGIDHYYPYSFTIHDEKPENVPMIFHFSTLEDQTGGSEKYENITLVDYHGTKINFPCLYQLVGTENVDYEMSFHLTYHYLMKNQTHLIRCESTLFDWETIKEVYQRGYFEGWLYKK
jgi:hypothetical protein